jgi:hypothetical protein
MDVLPMECVFLKACPFRGQPSNELAMQTVAVGCVREFGYQVISLQLCVTCLSYKDKLVCYLPVCTQDITEYCEDLSCADRLGTARITADTKVMRLAKCNLSRADKNWHL